MLTPRLRHREARLFLPAEPLRRFLGRTTELLVLAMALRALVMAAGKLVAACAAVSATMPIVFEMEAACAMMAVAGRDFANAWPTMDAKHCVRSSSVVMLAQAAHL